MSWAKKKGRGQFKAQRIGDADSSRELSSAELTDALDQQIAERERALANPRFRIFSLQFAGLRIIIPYSSPLQTKTKKRLPRFVGKVKDDYPEVISPLFSSPKLSCKLPSR